MWYCHTHQAFFASLSSYTQNGDDVAPLGAYNEIEFGPFDSWTDVRDWVVSRTPVIAALPMVYADE